ncbi:peptidase C26-like protein [Pseudomonas sp. LP_7_YM]|nr:peptidase C26-like protein [Pseudomonas sp. LP_7_YM]
MFRLPLIGVTAGTQHIGPHVHHVEGDKYVRAVAFAAKGLSPILPSLATLIEPADTLLVVDGLLFTGSLSCVELHHYSGPASVPGTAHDPARDRTTLPLIHAAVAARARLSGICSGYQERHLAFGGGLHQKIHETGTFVDHREPDNEPVEIQDAAPFPAHRARRAFCFIQGVRTECLMASAVASHAQPRLSFHSSGIWRCLSQKGNTTRRQRVQKRLFAMMATGF